MAHVRLHEWGVIPSMDNLFIKLLNERRVVTFFIASIVSDNIGVNVSELFKAEENKAVTDMLSREFAAVMEQCRFRARSREALYNAAESPRAHD